MSKDVNINAEALDEFLKGDLGDFLSDTKAVTQQVESLEVSSFTGDTPLAITKTVESFLERGASVLETMEIYCNNMPDSESVSAFASLISSLSSAINNIASVHNKIQDHQNRIELEERKHELKMKEIEFRERIKATVKAEAGPGEVIPGESAEELVEYNTHDIINQIVEINKK